ncbi:PspC domain-containing protein [Nocardiopsis salina]|uniref:PspC domain-containing protein n=1 Tax=Nocardiopsis salina TaxID=245836 RepID=UPI00034C77D9|nr:PspC domain-containing protein [Nocardiopsis salina]
MAETPSSGAPEGGDPPGPADPSGPAPGPEPELRKGEDRVLTGVCSGLGAYTGVDPVVWRAAFVLTAFAGATGVLLYVAAWMLMRDTGGGPSTLEQMLNRAFPSAVVLKLLAVGLASATAMSLVGGFGWGTMVLATPLIIGLLSARNRGVDLRATFLGLRSEMRRTEPAPAAPVPEPAPSYYNPAQPWASASPGPVDLAVVAQRSSQEVEHDEEDDEGGPEEARDTEGAEQGQDPQGFPLASAVWWVLIAAAVLTPMLFLGWGTSIWSGEVAQLLIGPDTGVFFMAGALALVGVLAIVGTWWGNPSGLWFLGIVLSLLAATASVTDLTRIGSATWEPHTVAELEEEDHRVTLGSGVMDLRMLHDLEPGEEVDVHVAVNGHTEVLLPEQARVEMTSWVGLGGIQQDGDSGPSGADVDFHRVYEPVEEGQADADGDGAEGDDAESGDADGGEAGPPVINLRTDSYVGHVEVEHGRSGN